MSDIVIEVSGGVVVAVYTDIPSARVVLVDWDDVAAGGAEVVSAGDYPHNRCGEMPPETRDQYAKQVLVA